MTNREQFKMVFGFDGSTVDCVIPDEKHIGSCGYHHCLLSCASRAYPRCPMWWDDEYKGKNENNET